MVFIKTILQFFFKLKKKGKELMKVDTGIIMSLPQIENVQ